MILITVFMSVKKMNGRRSWDEKVPSINNSLNSNFNGYGYDQWEEDVEQQTGAMIYQIIWGESIDELEREVAGCIAQNYEPIGGIAVIRSTWTNERKGYEESQMTFYQAVIRRKGGLWRVG